MDLDLAGIEGSPGARKQALLSLTELYPADPSSWTSLSQIAMANRDYTGAARVLASATVLHPEEPLLFNQLGYAAAYAGDLKAALAAGRRYEQLRPREANPLDSMGDFCLVLGRAGDAEAYYQAAGRKDPSFLRGLEPFKAAWARLVMGDVKGADADFARCPATPLQRAQWLWLTGRRAESMSQLKASGSPQARLQAALWTLEDGQVPRTPETLRQFPLPYAALLGRDFRGALPLLEQVHSRWTPGADPGIPVLLAWAYAETGRYRDAAELLARTPLPPPGPDMFTCLWFPRLFAVRAQVLDKLGKRGEAQESYRIFRALSGPASR